MKANTRALTRSAVSAALAVVLLYLGAVMPSGRLALTAVAGLAALFVMLDCGGKWSLGVFIVSALLALLLAPVKGSAVLYAAFLGYYPALKTLIERVRRPAAQWGIKLVLFNAVLLALYLLTHAILTDTLSELPSSLPTWLIWIGMNAVFLAYDVGLKGLIRVYIRHFSGKKNGVG